MNRPALLFFLALSILPTWAQSPAEVRNRRPVTVAERLQQHHIALETDALIRALQHPDPDVRQLAAAQLASKNGKEVTQELEQALAREEVPWARINIAAALARIGDESGAQSLQRDCESTNVPVYLRLRAASYLIKTGIHACVDSVSNIVETSSNLEDRVVGMSLLSDVSGVSPANSETLKTLARKHLQDAIPATRIAAANLLGRVGESRDAEVLAAALSREQDAAVREVIRRNLEGLKNKR